MKVRIEKDVLHISIPINNPPTPSKGGKTVLLATSHGNQKVELDGCEFWLGLNCYTYPELLKGFRSTSSKKKFSVKEKKEVEKHNRKVSEDIKNGKV